MTMKDKQYLKAIEEHIAKTEAAISEAKPKAFGSAIPTPILDEIIERASAPALANAIDNTLQKQRYYQTKVCCPCGKEDCNVRVALRFRSSFKDPYNGKWRPTWKEVPDATR